MATITEAMATVTIISMTVKPRRRRCAPVPEPG